MALKDAVKRAMPESVVRQVQRQLYLRDQRRRLRTKPIDLSRVDLIRSAPLERLSDPEYLESELLPELGLNDERLWEIPPSLHPYTGYGLRHWQLPNQFSKYLVELSQHRIESYLEIGSRHGGTFVITVEYLSRFHPVRAAVAVDLARSRSLARYARTRPGVMVLKASSQSDKVRKVVRERGPFDLALIDGDHSYEGCRADFELVEDRARIIVLHDITPSAAAPGVRRVWDEIKQTRADRFRTVEFTDPPPGTGEGVTGFGLGVAVREQ